jgi:hypothetical protein
MKFCQGSIILPAPKDPEKYEGWIEKLKNKTISEETRLLMSKAKKNIPLSEEHRKNISEANKGRQKSEEERKNISDGLKNKSKSEIHRQHLSESLTGNIPWNVGISPSEETKNKIRTWHIGKHSSKETRNKQSNSMRGESNPGWRGGITPLNRSIRRSSEYRLWILAVFVRDDFTCQKCDKRGIELNAHHIEEFSKIIIRNNIKSLEESILCHELWDINNGITLCVKCHKEEHFGKQNFNS